MSYFDVGQPPDGWTGRPPISAILAGSGVAAVGSLIVVYGVAVLVGFLNGELMVAAVGWTGFAAGLFVRFLGGWITAWMAARRFRREIGDPRRAYSVLAAGIGTVIGYVVFELVQILTTVVLTGSLTGPSAGTFLNVFAWVIPALVGATVCAIVLRIRERAGRHTSPVQRSGVRQYWGSW